MPLRGGKALAALGAESAAGCSHRRRPNVGHPNTQP